MSSSDAAIESPCCPPGSVGRSAVPFPQDLQGEVIELAEANMKLYVVGKDRKKAKSAVLVFTDVFGPEGGRHKIFCDELSEKLGHEAVVVMPDLFHGNPIVGSWGLPDWITIGLPNLPNMFLTIRFRCNAKNIEDDLASVVIPYVKEMTNDDVKLAAVGFCFGGWVIGRFLSLENQPSIACAVGIHPSWKPEPIGGDGNPLELAKRVGTKPILFLPAGNDDLKPNSPEVQHLAKQRNVDPEEVSVPFEEMKHGWVAREDPSKDEAVARDQARALEMASNFLRKHTAV